MRVSFYNIRDFIFLQSLRKLCIPQQRIGHYRPGMKQPKTMAVKHMAFFQGAGGSVMGGGMGSVADMWGDGVVSIVPVHYRPLQC